MSEKTVHLTNEQKNIADAFIDYAIGNKYGPYIAIAGYAGTGKTTVIGYVAAKLLAINRDFSIAYCAPTGKAASVMKKKLQHFGGIGSRTIVSTIHCLIYDLVEERDDGKLVFGKRDNELYRDLIVVDEASMVSDKMFNDLLSFNIPIIFIGDAGQLPPVEDKPFQPLIDTELCLNTVHRQALNNPIINVATRIRNGEEVAYGAIGDNFIRIKNTDPHKHMYLCNYADRILDVDTVFLCNKNDTRIDVNTRIRNMLGFKNKLPMEGEILVCLKNNKNVDMFNGEFYKVVNGGEFYLDDTCYRLRLNNNVNTLAYTGSLNTPSNKLFAKKKADWAKIMRNCKKANCKEPMYFDFGYVCTVHKAQGSEWDHVFMYNERNAYQTDDEFRQWQYTAITRAKETLCMAG